MLTKSSNYKSFKSTAKTSKSIIQQPVNTFSFWEQKVNNRNHFYSNSQFDHRVCANNSQRNNETN